jgi:exonuclease VII small subunit
MHIDNLKNWLDGKYVSPPDFKESLKQIIEQVERYEKDMQELEESLHIARVGRGDLTICVKLLKEENERLKKELNDNPLEYDFDWAEDLPVISDYESEFKTEKFK